MDAFRVTYTNSTMTGCYFHLCQSVLRETQELGPYVRTLYGANDEVRGMIRCLPPLAHVPVEDVLDAFEELATVPEHQEIDELLTYFEHTYIRGRRLPGRGHNYRPVSWNKRECATEVIARTLLLCNHPSVWTFWMEL